MFQPMDIVFDSRKIVVTRHTDGDYTHSTPLRQRVNLLRYSVTINPGPRRITINKGGKAWLWVQNATWPIRQRFFPPKWLREARRLQAARTRKAVGK